MIAAYSLLCVVGVPCFMAMARLRTPAVLDAAVALMSFLLALGLPAIMAQVGESLPLNMRSGGIGVIYAVAIAVFGGTTSFIVTWLTAITGSPLAPAFYMCTALALGVLSMMVLPETAPVRTSR
jgi:hypothetical protein